LKCLQHDICGVANEGKWLAMTEGDGVLGLFKFGASQHIAQFAQGLLYMNTLKHFVEVETNSLRRDSHEGTSLVRKGDGAILQIKITPEVAKAFNISGTDGEFKSIANIWGPIRFQPNALQSVNVFCMYALRESASDVLVDPRNFGFGDSFAILKDFDEFMKRVKVAAQRAGQELRYDLVEYIDEASYEGTVGIFRKLSDFSYQSEFRIGLVPGTGAPLRLQVGDLSDIVVLGCLSDLNDRLRVQANAQGRRELQIRT
jgi:hypothetical protein